MSRWPTDPLRRQAFVVGLSGVSCTSDAYTAPNDRYYNPLLNGGCIDYDGGTSCGINNSVPGDWSEATNNELKARCTHVEADFAFEFISCGLGLLAHSLSYVISRRPSANHY